MQKDEIIEGIKTGLLKVRLAEVYADDGRFDYQTARYITAIEKFAMLYGDGDISVFSAPGRVELVGNHTDHQHGKVIAAAINRDLIVVVKKTEDNTVRIISGESSEITVSLDALEMNSGEEGTTVALVKGILTGFRDMGYTIGGFEAYVTSDVPVGSGLSSSAAFETAIGNILSGLYNDSRVTDKEIAVIGQIAENIFFGKPCGLMDQMACSVGSLVYIDFACPADPKVEKLEYELNDLGYKICVTDTRASHENLTAEYAQIPAEMKSVAACFEKGFLNDVTREEFNGAISSVREKCSDRAVLRAMHFFDENERVEMEVKAIKGNNLGNFLKNIKDSGDSSYKLLQNIYVGNGENGEPISVALAISEEILNQTGAVRVHGGGFAGTILAIVPEEKSEKYKEAMDGLFGKGACNILRIRKFGGVKVI